MENMTIDTTSYTNKDFRTIFPELLELVNELTERWDPNASNEADPGVVLLKLQAFLADKLNYNLDKNILETFPSSVTQVGNAHKLYDLLGYQMKWYQSATVDVLLKYIKGGNPSTITSDYIIPRFTQLKNDDGTVVYTLMDDAVVLVEGGEYSDILPRAIEGTIHDYVLNGNTTITVDKLDSDYRLYFNESNVAQNGIFIYNVDTPYALWDSVGNLEATQLGRAVYKFGVLPVSNTCYIQFPQDSAELFGNGINIKYILSSGVSGNISAFTLTQLHSQQMSKEGEVSYYTDDPMSVTTSPIDLALYTKVKNSSAANNGSDPETVTSAYRNFQKTVNTFNTLVTTKDYENAIFNEGRVSNVVVGDRTTDLVNSYTIQTKDLSGDDKLAITQRDDNGNMLMQPYEISIYALNHVSSVYDALTYNKSFNTEQQTRIDAQDSIEEYKSLQHDYVNTSEYNPFLYKNLYRLKGKLLTYSKVSEQEAKDIQDNVQKALYKTYHSRNLEFGVELDYSDLVETIQNADSRIKTVMLDEPELVIHYMDGYNSLYDVNNRNVATLSTGLNSEETLIRNHNIDLYAKSILAGVTPFIMFRDDVSLNYFMRTAKGKPVTISEVNNQWVSTVATSETDLTATQSVLSEVAYITTEAEMTIPANGSYTIRENESLHLYAPNYVTDTELSTYLYVAIKFGGSRTQWQGVGSNKLPEGTLYQLREGDKLYVTENAQNMRLLFDGDESLLSKAGNYMYEYPTIIKPSFEFEYRNVGGASNETKIINLESNKTITTMKQNSVQINKNKQTILACWIANNPTNSLFENFVAYKADNSVANTAPGSTDIVAYYEAEKILKNDEIFIYTDKNKADLILLQSGTRLRVKAPANTNIHQWKYWSGAQIELSEIQTSGAAANYDWTEIPTSFEFYTDEMQIITLGQGTTVYGDTTQNNVFNNDAVSVKGNLSYKLEGDTEQHFLPSIYLSDTLEDDRAEWKGFSSLQGIISPLQPFKLLNGQKIETYVLKPNHSTPSVMDRVKSGEVSGTATNTPSLVSNVVVLLYGGNEQNVQALDNNGELETVLTLTQYKQLSDSDTLWEISGTGGGTGYNYSNDWTQTTTINEEWTQTVFDYIPSEPGSKTYKYKLTLGTVFENTVVPICFSADSDNCTISIVTNGGTHFQDVFNTASDTVTSNNLVNNVTYYLKPVVSSNNYILEFEMDPKVNTGANDTFVTRFTITMWSPRKLQTNTNGSVKTYLPGVYGGQIANRVKSLANIGELKDKDGDLISTYSLFNYTYTPTDDELIENPLDSESFFNVNHIRNKYTIAQIDTKNIDITVMKQSRK